MVRACVLLCSKVDFYHLLPFGVRSPLSLAVALLCPLSRFLEASGCASVCVHTCKAPTQEFFNQDMGVPMRMLPDYASYECVFEFGVAPTARPSFVDERLVAAYVAAEVDAGAVI